ncbi:hypothetical protein M885DRAFT_619413 [Pelagophyceae sp. CCMP2097]|nr:hypothetical protein M885DRAFT_619413 [Pelagophyceae sp. CCMP2097]|mmetsp:Transcript_3602/g.13175  ORF Transcript_3602/g.13175 Transcript_3602/m.13175 type:complete len:416 (-) Transcript_3602:51-1298(-)
MVKALRLALLAFSVRQEAFFVQGEDLGSGNLVPCDARFWPSMASNERRSAALMLINGEMVKLCFDASAPGTKWRSEIKTFVSSLGLIGFADDGTRSAVDEAIVDVLVRAKMERSNPMINVRNAPNTDSMAAMLRPSVSAFVGHAVGAVDAFEGEHAESAARRFCALQGLHSPAACEAEAAAAVARARGYRRNFSGDYDAARGRLESAAVKGMDCGDGSCAVEGGTFFYPFKIVALRSMIDDVLKQKEGVVEVCEVGFNMGHSSLVWLMASPRIRVRAWDLGATAYVPFAEKHLRAEFGDRLQLEYGDSTQTLSAFAAEFASEEPPEWCDVVFIDGGHSYAVAENDLLNLAKAARPAAKGGHVLIVDDPNQVEVGEAWRDAQKSGLVEKVADVFEQAHYAYPNQARSALTYGSYNV